jgi:hypothetical protein
MLNENALKLSAALLTFQLTSHSYLTIQYRTPNKTPTPTRPNARRIVR